MAIRFFGSDREYVQIDADGVMDATLILIDSDAELARARALVDRLWVSDKPADVARLQAQARSGIPQESCGRPGPSALSPASIPCYA